MMSLCMRRPYCRFVGVEIAERKELEGRILCSVWKVQRASSINPKKTNSRRCEAFLCCLSVGCCFMKHRSERHLLSRQICLLKIQSLSWKNHKEWVICRRPLTGKSVCHWSQWTLQAGASLQMCFELPSPLHIYICKDFSLPSLPFTKA